MTQASDGSDSGAGGLPVLPPLAALVEIVILVVVPALLDLFVQGFPTLNEMQPHFFWVPVLLLTMQYGSASGLLAAGVAIVFASTLGWPEQEIGENHFSYQLRIWLQPVLWIAAAVILGQLRLRQIERKQSLSRSVAELTAQRQALAAHAEDLRTRCASLETFIANRHEAPPQVLLAALGRAQSSAVETARIGFNESLELAFGGSRARVYLVDGGGLRPAFGNAASDAAGSRPITAGTALFDALVQQARPLTVLDAADESVLDGHALAAVPVFGGAGVPIGALLLEAVSPDRLGAETTDRLAALAAAIAVHLTRQTQAEHGQRGAHSAPPLAPSARAAPRPAATHWRRVRRGIERAAPGSRSFGGKA